MNFLKKSIYVLPLIYLNYINNFRIIKYTVNILSFIYFYNNRHYFLEEIVNFVLNVKIKIIEFINLLYKKDDYKLEKIILYIDLDKSIDVTNFFKRNNIKNINKVVIRNAFYENMADFQYNTNIRLKIFFIYKNVNYIIYFPYDSLYNIDDHYLPYPPFSEEILNNYRNDIIEPYYNNNLKKKYFYSLFNIDSKDIFDVKINNISDENLIKYFKMIQTPFNDFGLLYKTPIKLSWIIHENNIKNFETLYIKFLNLYLDEDLMDLKEHIMEFNKDDLDRFIVSERMEKILLLKNKNYINN